MSNSDSAGRAGRRRSRRARGARDLPGDERDTGPLPDEDDHDDEPGDAHEAAGGGDEEPPRRSRGSGRKRSAAGKGRKPGRGKEAPVEGGARRRRRAPAGEVDPVSKFSASALRRVTVLGDRPSGMVYKLAEQSQRKRGSVVLGTLLALCGTALLALAGVLVFQLVSDGSVGQGRGDTAIVEPPAGHSTLLPKVFQGKQEESEVFEPIATRPGGAEPLTEEKVFGNAEELELDDLELTLRDSQVTDTCTSLVWGEELAETLADGSCTSAASGVYQDPDDDYVAQFTLFDLEDQEAANRVAQAVDPTDHTTEPGFLLPQDTEIQGLREGYSQATTQVMGHYLAVYWVARADGGEPGDDTTMATLNVVAMSASVAVYEEVRDASQAED
ncbi:hypothetical protein [Allosalinactinospora lopnorensis]|uniref:hypothetical protein n=1 Tax=Allosalinactinospora lopnorensis TaxID=1352348 RepID=UPI000623FEB6|nr:hypothetical protein [Allosalinactinospora lopnorensis]